MNESISSDSLPQQSLSLSPGQFDHGLFREHPELANTHWINVLYTASNFCILISFFPRRMDGSGASCRFVLCERMFVFLEDAS